MEKYEEVLNYLKSRKEYFESIDFSVIDGDFEKAINVIKELINEKGNKIE